MDINAIGGIVIVLLGLTPCIVLVLFDKWLRHRGARTHHALTVFGMLLLASTVIAAARIIDALPPQEATLVTGIIVIGCITVFATVIECMAVGD